MELSEGNNIGRICRRLWYFRFRLCFRLKSIGKTGYGKHEYRNAQERIQVKTSLLEQPLVAIKLLCMACTSTSTCYRPFTLDGWVQM